MRLDRFFRQIATLGPIGQLPASGTVASALTMFVLFVTSVSSRAEFPVAVLFISIIAAVCIEWALPTFYSHDPRQIVIDEVVGCLVASFFVPNTLLAMIVLLITFRFFDIIKPLGLRRLEYLRGVQGIMFDDIIAGMYAGITTALLNLALLKFI